MRQREEIQEMLPDLRSRHGTCERHLEHRLSRAAGAAGDQWCEDLTEATIVVTIAALIVASKYDPEQDQDVI